MATVELEGLRETQEEQIQRWRYEQLTKAGYDVGAALALAERRDVDLHLAVELLQRGCAPDTALRILL